MNCNQGAPNYTIASIFQVFNNEFIKNEDFMLGWRLWSFHMTEVGKSKACITTHDIELIRQIELKGSFCKIESKKKWNDFRTSILNIAAGTLNPRMHYHDQYRLIFKEVAFVLVDCCFAVKYKTDRLHELLTEMFRKTDATEMPKYFILINNHIMNSELDHKMGKNENTIYINTQNGIKAYRNFNPTFNTARMQKTYIPFAMSHTAMLKAEIKAQKKMTMIHNQTVNRASINDYAQLYLIDQLRKSFGQCARVALLSDDHKMINTASKFVVPSAAKNGYPNLPKEYLESYIITPNILTEDYWNGWRDKHVYDAFANSIGRYFKH